VNPPWGGSAAVARCATVHDGLRGRSGALGFLPDTLLALHSVLPSVPSFAAPTSPGAGYKQTQGAILSIMTARCSSG
jgi:hypothetical protein